MTSATPPDQPARPYPPPMPERRERKPIRPVDATVLGGGLLMLLAASMPWIAATDGYGQHYGFGLFHTSRSGWDVLISAGLAVVLGGAALAGARSVLIGLGAVATGSYATFLGCVHFQSARVRAIRYDLLPAGVDIDPGAGTVLMAIAGVLAGVAGTVSVCQEEPGRPRLRRHHRVALLGAMFVTVALFVPWATRISRSGDISFVNAWDAEQVRVALLAVGALVAAVAWAATGWNSGVQQVVLSVLGVGAIVQAVALFDTVHTSWFLASSGVTDPGAGLFALVLGGGLLLLAAGLTPRDRAV